MDKGGKTFYIFNTSHINCINYLILFCDLGFNCGGALNFANDEWFPLGAATSRCYALLKMMPLIPYALVIDRLTCYYQGKVVLIRIAIFEIDRLTCNDSFSLSIKYILL